MWKNYSIFLHEYGIISGQIFNQWLQDKENSSIPGKELSLQLISKWINSLPPDQEEEDDEEDEENYENFPYDEEEEEESEEFKEEKN